MRRVPDRQNRWFLLQPTGLFCGVVDQPFQEVADTNRVRSRTQVVDIGGRSQQSNQPENVVPLPLGCFVRLSVPLQFADNCIFRRSDRNLDRPIPAQTLRSGSSHRLQIEWPLAAD